ncbi:MAG: ABC transporter ATP-binding protein [Candidatus Moranbacteria bacterium]|nr:ABC transporter ATP-binding protein [Candidatus Moranbacteria bacterium]
MNHKFAIRVVGVDKSYGDLSVLSDINIKVRKGEFVTIVGPTGCGKSTLFRLLLGSEKPDRGMILADDKQVLQPDRNRGIVFQKYSLFPDKTVEQNVMFGLELEYYNLWETFLQKVSRGIYKRSRQAEFLSKTRTYLESVGLWEARNKYPHELSGGMKQRVSIAQTLIMKPKVLLMDEPFGALDFSTRESMQIFLLEQWAKFKTTVLFVTHDLDEALFLGTRLIVLSQHYQKTNGASGAKIVKDIALPWLHPRPSSVKGTPEFADLGRDVLKAGLDPNHLQSIQEFNLTHYDAEKII